MNELNAGRVMLWHASAALLVLTTRSRPGLAALGSEMHKAPRRRVRYFPGPRSRSCWTMRAGFVRAIILFLSLSGSAAQNTCDQYRLHHRIAQQHFQRKYTCRLWVGGQRPQLSCPM